MKHIEYILDIDRHNSDRRPLSEIEYQIVRYILAGMPSADFLELSKQLRKDGPIFSIYGTIKNDEHKHYHSPIQKEDYRPWTPKTESFDCLLNWVFERI